MITREKKAAMTKNTSTANNGVEVYESMVQYWLDRYITEHGIENMHKESQNRWSAALLYIRHNYFDLDRDNLLKGGKHIELDLTRIEKLIDIYVSLCYEYEKEISVMGFCKMTGVESRTIDSWAKGGPGSNPERYRIAEKLLKEREESLSNMLVTGRKNPVGLLGVLNRHYAWNMGQPRGTQRERQESIAQLQERYKTLPGGRPAELPEKTDVFDTDFTE